MAETCCRDHPSCCFSSRTRGQRLGVPHQGCERLTADLLPRQLGGGLSICPGGRRGSSRGAPHSLEPCEATGKEGASRAGSRVSGLRPSCARGKVPRDLTSFSPKLSEPELTAASAWSTVRGRDKCGAGKPTLPALGWGPPRLPIPGEPRDEAVAQANQRLLLSHQMCAPNSL